MSRSDDAFEAYLRGDSELSRLYREQSLEQPSADTDRRILDLAETLCPRPRRPLRRVALPALALAASVLLGLGLVRLVLETEPPPAALRQAAPPMLERRSAPAESLAQEPASPRSAPEPAPARLRAPSPPDAAGSADGAGPADAPATAESGGAGEPAVPSSAAAWIERIRALRAAGREVEAARQLRAFRLAYPEHPFGRDPGAGESAGRGTDSSNDDPR